MHAHETCCISASMRITLFSQLLFASTILRNACTILALPNGRNLLSRNPSYQLVNNPSDLDKRLENQLQSFLTPQGLTISYITWAHFIPIQFAALGLQHLYEAIMTTAQYNQLIQTPLSNEVVITIGWFTFTLASNRTIPWIVLHGLAAKLWLASSLGWVSQYTITFVSPSGEELKANLRVSEGGGRTNPRPPAPPPRISG